MTTIDRDRIRFLAEYLDSDAAPLAASELATRSLALLDGLDQAERRATRAEAQSETRRQQTKYWQERAEGFEARIAAHSSQRASVSAMGTRSMNIGAVRRALGGVAGESTALARAEARIQAVRDMHEESGPINRAGWTKCLHCSAKTKVPILHPCPTIRAMDAP